MPDQSYSTRRSHADRTSESQCWLLVIGLATALLFSPTAFGGVSKKDLQNLPQQYRKWLTQDVAYIATEEEKEAFIRLTTDPERDSFIEHFWAIRNPNLGAPVNSYKEEIYRRIAYADQWYGHNSGEEGSRTDRGRVYITLGAPQQVGKYLGFANIRPMEIWFYSNDNPALPPFFYVVFYQRETGGEMRLYSPFMDGPEKLVTGPYENDRMSAWNLIDHDAGREVSRTVLSLLPSEPVDIQTATASMASDMLLNNIHNLANHPLNKDYLRERGNLLEAVSHRVILQGDYLDLVTIPLLGTSGDINLHYAIRTRRADDFSLAQDDEKRYYYSASINVRVLTPEGKLIFTQERKLSSYLDDRQYVRVRNSVFGYEGLLPLPPGKYKLEFQLTDEIKHTAFRVERDVAVPNPPSEGLLISDVVPFAEAVASRDSFLPFTAAGVRFTPVSRELSLVPGGELEFFYQLRVPSSVAAGSDALKVEYAYGRMGAHDTQKINEDLARNQFDANGSMINGKKIPTAGLAPGTYRMMITVTEPSTRARAVASFQFRIADTDPSPPVWDVIDPLATDDVQQGRHEYQRALCYMSQGDPQNAVSYLRAAFAKNPDDRTRNQLIDLLYSRQAFAEVSELYSKGGVTAETSDDAVLAMAESLRQLGQAKKAIQVLESALSFRQSSTLYLSLARYYELCGDERKASEMEEKAKALSSPSQSGG